MPSRNFPGLGLTGGWSDAESGWGAAMNQNLRLLSALTQLTVLDVVEVGDLPGSPTDGMMYIVLDGASAGSIYLRDDGAWVTVPPFEGLFAFNQADGMRYRYVGGAWTSEVASVPPVGAPVAAMYLRVNETGDGLEWSPLVGLLPNYNSADYGKKLAVFDDGGTPALRWETIPALPVFSGGDVGRLLRVNGTGDAVEWFTLDAELPSYNISVAGRVLKVNGTGDAVEWGIDGTGDTLPSYSLSEAGRVLKVNVTGDAVEWGVDGTGTSLPSYGAPEAGKVLKVNGTGDAVEWATDGSGGSGLPVFGSGEANFRLAVNATGDDVEWRREGVMKLRSGSGTTASPTVAWIGDFVSLSDGTGVSVTIGTDAAESWPDGATLTFRQAGAGQITVAGDSGVTVAKASAYAAKTREMNSVVTLVRVGSDSWLMFGDMEVL